MFIVSELHIIRYLQSYIHIRMIPWIFMILLWFANPFMTLETIDLFIRAGVHEIDVKIGGNIQKPQKSLVTPRRGLDSWAFNLPFDSPPSNYYRNLIPTFPTLFPTTFEWSFSMLVSTIPSKSAQALKLSPKNNPQHQCKILLTVSLFCTFNQHFW